MRPALPRLRLAALLVSLLALSLGLKACATVVAAPDLDDHWRLVVPDGPGPHRAAVLLSGCDGVRDNMDYWAEVLAATGRASLIVDSHSPRGLAGPQAYALVCTGAAMRGAARAEDVARALEALAAAPGIDARDVLLLGASHGGWTAMEFLASDHPARERVGAAVLLYPYCGLLNGAHEWGDDPPPALMVLGEADRITSPTACAERAAELRAAGAEVEAVTLPGADHAYDQRERPDISLLAFDPALRERARAAVAAWIAREAP